MVRSRSGPVGRTTHPRLGRTPMTLHRRSFLTRSAASAALLATAGGPTPARAAEGSKAPRRRGNRIVVSTYSFWQFRNARYRDIELCIDLAAEMGFDGFEI